MDVTLPNGVVIRGVPEGTTKDQIMQKAIASGMAKAEDFGRSSAIDPINTDVPLLPGMEGYDAQQAYIQSGYDQRAQESKLTPLDYVKGIPEVAATLATGATTGLIGQAAGAAQQFGREVMSGEFGSPEAANRIEQRAADVGGSATYSPTSPAAQNMLGGIAAVTEPLAGLAPLSELAAVSGNIRPAMAVARGRAADGAEAAGTAIRNEAAILAPNQGKQLAIIQKIREGSTENELAPYRVEPKNPNKPATKPEDFKLVDDDVAKKALNMEWEPGTVQSVKNFDPKTASVAARMLRVAQVGTKDDTFKANHRPLAELGDEFAAQVATVKRAKKDAGKAIEAAANELKTERVDVAPAVDRFLGEVSDGLGVKLIPTEKGIKVDFRGSDLEGKSPEFRSAQGVIQNLVERMYNTRTPSAYDVHRLKQFIDSQASYGSALGGMKGNADRIVKGLRHDLDEILDTNFESYRVANEAYSETKTAIDAVQELAGKKVDLEAEYTPQALGRLSRRILSNAQSAERVREALINVDDVALKYGAGESAGDLAALVKFADTLDKQFGIAADTSFASEIAKGVTQGQSQSGLIMGGLKTGYKKIKGVNTDNKYKAMNELLDRQRKARGEN